MALWIVSLTCYCGLLRVWKQSVLVPTSDISMVSFGFFSSTASFSFGYHICQNLMLCAWRVWSYWGWMLWNSHLSKITQITQLCRGWVFRQHEGYLNDDELTKRAVVGSSSRPIPSFRDFFSASTCQEKRNGGRFNARMSSLGKFLPKTLFMEQKNHYIIIILKNYVK